MSHLTHSKRVPLFVSPRQGHLPSAIHFGVHEEELHISKSAKPSGRVSNYSPSKISKGFSTLIHQLPGRVGFKAALNLF